MVLAWGVGTIGAFIVFVGIMLLARAGMRVGDAPEDVVVTVTRASAVQPDEPVPVVRAIVRNPASVPVLVGLSVRSCRLPGWLQGGIKITVPRRTTRKQLLPEHQTLIGVLDAHDMACWSLPIPPPPARAHLIAVVGQAHQRLRVIEHPIIRASHLAPRAPGSHR